MASRNPRDRCVAVLGAGIMGCCLALFLARRGIRVNLFDARDRPMAGASRWNEGKIHLGYLYGADASLATARHLLPGGLRFKALAEQLIEQALDDYVTTSDDMFLIHRDSVVDAARARAYYRAVDELIQHSAGTGDYLCDLRGRTTRELSPGELAAIADPALVTAGFGVPERSVQTHWLADRLCDAVDAEPGIEQRMGERVTAVHRCPRPDKHWEVVTAAGRQGFDCVVNALWEGRLAIDATVGLPRPTEWSARYRLALFARTPQALAVPSAVLGIGPFGDVKNYNGRDFYLSWYPAGLAYTSDGELPGGEDAVPAFDDAAVARATRDGLSAAFGWVDDILAAGAQTRVGGGWVVAQGRGPLSSATSTLHRRDAFGVSRLDTYYSVDTGKYSTAPWLAHSLAQEIAGG